MVRSLVGIALALVLSAPIGLAQPPGFPRGPSFPQPPGFPNNPGRPGAGAPNAGFPAAGPEMNSGTCSSCNKDISWSGGSANAPKKCPHCGVKIGYVNNDDGTRTNLASGKTYEKTPLWLGALIVAIAVVVILAIVIGKVVQSQSSGSGKKRGKKKPRRREIDDDDDDDEDDAPRRTRDKPVKRASRADDDFEVVGDAPTPPVEPPRRAKPKLIQPGDGR